MKLKDYNFGFADSETEFNRNPEIFKEAFYDPKNMADNLINGNEFILIGNKGAGKTAYSAKIRSLVDSKEDLNAYQVSLSNFDFEVFSTLSRDNYTGSQKFKLAWDTTLLIEIYKFLNKSDDYSCVDSFYNIREFLSENNLMNINSINTTVRRFTNIEINIKECFKMNTEKRKLTVGDYSLQELNDYFKDSLKDINFNLTNLLIIDGLDDILRYEKSKIEILSGLFRSISNLNNDFYQNRIPIKIIILAREDILASITDPDFNKIKRDGGIRLNWNANDLMEIVKRRFLISGVEEDKLGEWWYNIFPRTMKNDIDSFQYILQYTLNKPRDILQFLQQCKREYPAESKLNFSQLKNIMTQYSVSYFYEEMKNELSGFMDDADIDNLELVFIDIGKIDFKYNRFAYVCKKHFKNKDDEYINKVFNMLYENSYIGQVIQTNGYNKKTKKKTTNRRVALKHKEPHIKINRANDFTLHKGLHKAFSMDIFNK